MLVHLDAPVINNTGTQSSTSSDNMVYDPKLDLSLIQRTPYSTAYIDSTYLEDSKSINAIGTGFFYIHNELVSIAKTHLSEDIEIIYTYPNDAIDAYFNRPINNNEIKKIQPNGMNKLYLITNKHVLRGNTLKGTIVEIKLRLNFVKQYNVKGPIESIYITVEPASVPIKEHPDEMYGDLCSIDISTVIKDFEATTKFKLLYYAYTNDLLATDFTKFGIYDDIAMIGYPAGYYDDTNNLPILRGGKIASVPGKNWNNYPMFLIDCSCFPGSSGSPVLSVQTEEPEVYTSVNKDCFGRKTIESEFISGKKTITLLGILNGGLAWSAKGTIKANLSIPVEGYASYTSIPINIGHVIKASEISKIVGTSTGDLKSPL